MGKENGFQIDIIPFIKTQPLVSDKLTELIHHFASVPVNAVFTSMNAAQAVIEELGVVKPLWRIYCIGNTTQKTLIQHFGEEAIVGLADNASSLAQVIIEEGYIKDVIFFCGDQRRDELPGRLTEKKIRVQEIIVYRTIPVSNKISQSYQGILFFSPSAVTSFFSDNTIEEQTILFAIGETTAEALKRYTNNKIIIGKTAGQENLVNTMITYYQSCRPQKNISSKEGDNI